METIEGITIMNIDQTLTGFKSYIEDQGGLPHVNR